ncbi:TIR domain-containing protein [Methylobacterium sp. sgz302541]|uniref:TIR domain-containing protein n=1 Tax=unclassified Methylobacterium TaxID=2615210 RepID=UPI003D34740A
MAKRSFKSSHQDAEADFEKQKPPLSEKSASDLLKSKRTYNRQSDFPSVSLDDALRLPSCMFEHYAGKPASPFQIAKALDIDPKGSQLRVLSGAAIAYGLIEGGAQASAISVTSLSDRIFRPKIENDDMFARREALLKPRILNEFLNQYNNNQIPRADIACNVLEGMGVPREKVEEVFDRLISSARSVGFIQEIKGKSYVQLNMPDLGATTSEQEQISFADCNEDLDADVQAPKIPVAHSPQKSSSLFQGTTLSAAFSDDQRRKKVFITHGKDRDLVDPIKKLLEYGELEPVVSVERQSVSKPVPEKVMDDMRKCGAAIIHVDADNSIKDADGNDHIIINPNVLIEIGAAMAFYGRRFILLVQEGVKLPSNLQGLYEVRYSGPNMDAASTIKLLEAMKDIKNYPLPTDKESD